MEETSCPDRRHKHAAARKAAGGTCEIELNVTSPEERHAEQECRQRRERLHEERRRGGNRSM